MERRGKSSSRNKQEQQQGRSGKVGALFTATVVIWGLSVLFEIAVKKRSQLLPVVCGFIFFQTSNFLIRLCFSSDAVFVNTSVSLLHSSLTSSFVVFILLNQWHSNCSFQMFDHDQLVRHTWPWAYTALSFSSGYFAYDQWDMLKYRLYTPSSPSVLTHHLILLLCFTLALYRNVTINYLILTLLCELHSVFLHVRKVRRMAGIRNAESAIVKVEWVLNCFTFIFARAIPHVLILIKLLRDASKFDKGIELPLACFGMVGMNALNIGLAIDLLGAYKRETGPPQNHPSD